MPEQRTAGRRKKAKPPFLYHGSPNRTLDELRPRKGGCREDEEELYASQDKAYATLYLIQRSKNDVFVRERNGVLYALFLGTREQFLYSDTGGAVYTIPSDTFHLTPHGGLRYYEWSSKHIVKPVEVTEYKSFLDAAIENGVQVYFVDETQFRDFASVEGDLAFKILENVESENQRRAIEIRRLYGET